MARHWGRLSKVGDIVYPVYRAGQVGKVVALLPPNYPPHVLQKKDGPTDNDRYFYQRVLVRWLKKGNPETAESARNLQGLMDLIIDHEKKLQGHRDRYAKAEAL